MKRLRKPTTLIIALSVVGALVWFFIGGSSTSNPEPVAVDEDELEVVWLNSATSADAWRRFVQAVEDVFPGTKADKRTFPDETTSTPELRVNIPGSSQRLVFRWYKLTGQWKADSWIRALLQRDPPPVAIIGGSNSDQAKTIAQELQENVRNLPRAKHPLFLITTATAEKFTSAEGSSSTYLMDVYKGRTFRFSFTNEQMCSALLDFIWTQKELSPNCFPYYQVLWKDDVYSQDLVDEFVPQIRKRQPPLQQMAIAGIVGSPTFGALSAPGWLWLEAQKNVLPLGSTGVIHWSVGSFDHPNRIEVDAALYLLSELDRHPWQKKPLLVLPGQTKSARRFLRALERLSPMQTRNFVVVTGDAISFNSIYRDNDVSWPIQDLPCSLVSFAHHNPIDPKAGFATEGEASNGTNDLLLSRNVVRALKEVCENKGGARLQAGDLLTGFRNLRLGANGPELKEEGSAFFTPEGNRHSDTGEHVIWLEPRFAGQRVLPEATLSVWTRDKKTGRWLSKPPLTIYYSGYTKLTGGSVNETRQGTPTQP